MKTKNPKFYWHIHHMILVEPEAQPIKERIKYIKEYKSQGEIETRLRLLKPVKGELPVAVLSAGKSYAKALVTLHKAFAADEKACNAANKADAACIENPKSAKARKAYNKAKRFSSRMFAANMRARRVYNTEETAYDQAILGNYPALKALHRQECPNCPWDGKTIFPY
jgi:hypothetical protein